MTHAAFRFAASSLSRLLARCRVCTCTFACRCFVITVGKHMQKQSPPVCFGTQQLPSCVQLWMTSRCRLMALKKKKKKILLGVKLLLLSNLSAYGEFLQSLSSKRHRCSQWKQSLNKVANCSWTTSQFHSGWSFKIKKTYLLP